MIRNRILIKTIVFSFVAFVLGLIIGLFLLSKLQENSGTENASVTDIVNAVSPAVVSIVADTSPTSFDGSAGTGFIASTEGLVITNRHVVDDPEAVYTVHLSDGRTFEVKEIEFCPGADLAVLELKLKDDDFSGTEILKFADSDLLEVGQEVIALGSTTPDFQVTVSTGVVSALGLSIEAAGILITEELMAAIETDAAIYPGNSGGPLLNMNGEVIGVNTALESTHGLISYAIPSNEAKYLIERLN